MVTCGRAVGDLDDEEGGLLGGQFCSMFDLGSDYMDVFTLHVSNTCIKCFENSLDSRQQGDRIYL